MCFPTPEEALARIRLGTEPGGVYMAIDVHFHGTVSDSHMSKADVFPNSIHNCDGSIR